MSLAVLVFAALSVRAEVFPEPLCKNLPAVNPEVKAWVARVAPELAQVPVRELPEKTALDVFHRAAAAGWGGIDILTHDAFREPCTFHFSREALRAVDAAFDLDLLPPVRGHDRTGQAFEMAAILAGRGKLVVFYDRDGIAYRSEQHGREFRFAARVEFDTPVAGALEHIQGLCAKVFLFGCVRVRSMVKEGSVVEVRAGTFTSRSPLKPIQARGTAPEALDALADADSLNEPRVGPGWAGRGNRGSLGSRRARAWYHAAHHPARPQGDSMPRDTVLVTGGNSGIGFECARELAREGWHVLIASRNRDASRRAVQRIAEECGPDTISEASLDLGSLADVRRFAKELEAADLPLRALVCNAGLQLNDGPRLSPDGYELTFAVNHLGHFLLTHLLLPRLQANAPARVVVVASGVHDPSLRTGMPKPAISDLETLAATGGPSRDGFDGRLAYVNSKLCNLWFTYELARRSAAAAPDVRVNAYEPGLVPGSGLARDYPPVLRFIWNHVGPGVARVASAFTPRINPAPRSGRALARMVLDPALADVHGGYFPSHTRWVEGRSSGDSYDADRARELWEWSARTAGLASTG